METEFNEKLAKEMDSLNFNLRNLLFGPIQQIVKGSGNEFMQMPFSHRKILSVLFNAGSCSVKKLALNAYLSVANMGKVIDKLEESGYVIRKFDPNNKRVNIIELTDAGRMIIKEFDELSYAAADEIMSVFSCDEKVKVLDLSCELNELLSKIQEKED
ncbi:MAG: MarR family transcriptional regulator [Clostridia bacterium]|nr:MarR family transcriptional regulator [Clostridia bacterium]